MDRTLSIIIGTAGRATLPDALLSVVEGGLRDGDQLVVVFDTDEKPPTIDWPGPGRLTQDWTGKCHQDWAGVARNRGMVLAKGEVLAFLDDDDAFEPGALELYRDIVRPAMFRTWRPSRQDHLWKKKKVAIGNVSTQLIVVPNIPNLLGEWGLRYHGDVDFIQTTAAKWRGLDWRQEVTTQWNKLRQAYR